MKNYGFVFLVITITIIIVMTIKPLKNDESIGCESILNIDSKSNNVNADLNLIFTLDNKQGWATIRGFLHKNKDTFNVNRKVYFKVTKIKDSYKLESTNIVINDDNTNLIKDILPSLYVEKGQQRDILILEQYGGGYLFTSSNVYSFYCQ